MPVTAAAPAMAANYSHRDAIHDVSRLNAQGAPLPAAAYALADIRNTTVTYSKRTFRTVVTLRSVGMTHLKYRDMDVYLKTPGHSWQVSYEHSATQDFAVLNGASTKCYYHTHGSESARSRTMSVSFHSSCLKGARTIRVAVEVVTDRVMPNGNERTYTDNAQSRKPWNNAKPLYGPPVHLG